MVGPDLKYITADEIGWLRDASLRLFPIHQRMNNSVAVMTPAKGAEHAREATERARVLGLPAGTVIYFCVDFDPTEAEVRDIMSYFQAVKTTTSEVLADAYQVGVYGTRLVCNYAIAEGHAVGAFVAGMSTGYAGNMGVLMPTPWHYNQILETNVTIAGVSTNIDKDVVSSQAPSVDLAHVIGPPKEQDGSPTETGFDTLFEWVVRAEVACERQLAISNDPEMFGRQFQTIYHIADWLRRPKYWGDNDGSLWNFYTNVAAISNDAAFQKALIICDGALERMIPTKPESCRDFEHWAATLLGYLCWPSPFTAPDTGHLGDLGGWPLDLFQAWGAYRRAGAPARIDLWFADNLGRDDSGFGQTDLIADADAYLIYRDQGTQSGRLSRSLRDILQKSPTERVAEFQALRFDNSAENVTRAFIQFLTGFWEGGIPYPGLWLSQQMILVAAGIPNDRLPYVEEAMVMVVEFKKFLDSFGN